MKNGTLVKDKKGEHPFGDAGQLIIFIVFMLVWILDSFILKKTVFAAQYIPFYIRLAVFVALFIAMYYILKACRFIIEGEERPGYVVKTGVYKYIRHPMYIASMMPYLGFVILTTSLASLAVFLGSCFFYNYIADYEEKVLLNKFGRDYANYMKKTGRWFPRLFDKK